VHLVQAGRPVDALDIVSACVSAYHRQSQTQDTSAGFKVFLKGQKLFIDRVLPSLSNAVVPSEPASVFRDMVLEAMKKVRIAERCSSLTVDVRNAFHSLYIALNFIDVLVCHRFHIKRLTVFQATPEENWGGGIFYRD
jgi:hypothetical protein